MSRYYVRFIDADAVEAERQRLLEAGEWTEAQLDDCADWWDPADYEVTEDVGDKLADARVRAKEIIEERAEYSCGTLCEVLDPDEYGMRDSRDLEDLE